MTLRAISVLVLAAVAMGCGRSATSVAPTHAPSTTPTATGSTAATEAPSPTSEVPTLTFESTFAFVGGDLNAITAIDRGYLAGGCRYRPPSGDGTVGCSEAIVLSSPDGRTWSEVDLPDAANKRVIEIARTPFGLVALGYTVVSEPPAFRAAWRSTDGHRWEPWSIDVPPTIAFDDVVVLPDRTLFIGEDYAADIPGSSEAWATVDGTSWSSGGMPNIPKVAAHPGVVAVGLECEGCEPGEENHLYRSSDGFEWTAESIPAEMAATTVSWLAARDGRAIIGGWTSSTGGSEAILWHDDPDGWRPVHLEGGVGYRIAAVLVVAHGELVHGRSDSDGPAKGWWSADGRTYSPIDVGGLGDAYIADATGLDPLVLLIDSQLWVMRF